MSGQLGIVQDYLGWREALDLGVDGVDDVPSRYGLEYKETYQRLLVVYVGSGVQRWHDSVEVERAGESQ